jgi:hypothetical protein
MLTPEEPDTEQAEGMRATIGIVATAVVTHVAPCTPDCVTCYPEGPA